MSAPNFQLMWGPAVIGMTIGGALYGVGMCQTIAYFRAFPFDKVQLKFLVYFVFALDTAQTICLVWTYHYLLIKCRRKDSPECVFYLPKIYIADAILLYCITFVVQSFYVHRIWIISGRNRVITSAVSVTAFAQLVFGLMVTAGLIVEKTFQALFTIQAMPLAALASAICDAIITSSIIYYLRPTRPGVSRRGNYIKKLNIVFVQMGLLSLINASALAVTYYVQADGLTQFLTAAPGIVLSKSYTNSMLSVLNVRKSIREEQEARARRPIEIPTISTIPLSQ